MRPDEHEALVEDSFRTSQVEKIGIGRETQFVTSDEVWEVERRLDFLHQTDHGKATRERCWQAYFQREDMRSHRHGPCDSGFKPRLRASFRRRRQADHPAARVEQAAIVEPFQEGYLRLVGDIGGKGHG
nr:MULTISPECIES: hypothetical protein [Myxococcus]